MAGAGAIEIEAGDIDTLAQILEIEKQSHARKRSICLAMFVITLASLLVVLTVGAVQVARLMSASASGVELADQMWLVQVLAPLGAMAVSFFSAWWGVQNCLNAIDRTLFAARAKRHHLFAKFLEQVECAEKKKRHWVEFARSLVG